MHKAPSYRLRRVQRRWRVLVPKLEPCVSRRRNSVAGLCRKPYDSKVRVGPVRRPGGPENRAGLANRTREARPFPQPEGLGYTDGPEPRDEVPSTPCRSTVRNSSSLQGALGAQRGIAVHRGCRCRRPGRHRSRRQRGRLQIALRLRTSTGWATFALPPLPASSATPMPPPKAVTAGGGNDSRGRRVHSCRSRALRAASAAGLGGAGPIVLAASPTTSVSEGEERLPVVDRGCLAVGRGGSSPSHDVPVIRPGRTLRRHVVRGEGREPVIGPRGLFEGPTVVHAGARFPVVRVAGDRTSLATLTSGRGRVVVRGGGACAHFHLDGGRAIMVGSVGVSGVVVDRPALADPEIMLSCCRRTPADAHSAEL